MITAAQASRLHTASKLYEARSLLAGTRNSICWVDEQPKSIDKIVAEIDELFEHLIVKYQGEKL